LRTSIALCACLALVAAPAAAQQAFYPAKHQSKATQEKDRGHCDEWAVKQSGFNPAYAYAPQKKTGAVAKGAYEAGALSVIAERGLDCRLIRCGVRSLPEGISGSQTFMHTVHSLSPDALCATATSALEGLGRGARTQAN